MIRSRSGVLVLAGVLLLFSGCGSNSQPFNDTPVITSLFPSSATAGGPAFTLNIAGTGFIATSIAYWNNSPRATTFNSTTTQISIMVTAQDIANAGTAQIIVVSPSPGGGPSTAVNFTINAPSNPAPTITSISPASTAVGVAPAGGVLTVNGTNFVSTSAVAFNGNVRATTFVNSTQVTAAVGSSDVATNATINVTVTNPAPGGGVSNSMGFKVGTGGSVKVKAAALALGTQFPELVSASAAGGFANGASTAQAVSDDGRFVAFYSTATNLAASGAGAWGASGNVFVRDTCLGAAGCTPQTMAVDVAPDGSGPNGTAEEHIAISGDGRYVAFASLATNLVAGLTGLTGTAANTATENVYVRDMCLGSDAPAGCAPGTEFISRDSNSNGNLGSGASEFPSLSADGRYVAFLSANLSTAANLAGDGAAVGAENAVYIRDTCAGAGGVPGCVPATYLATSSADTGAAGGQKILEATIAEGGRYIVYSVADGASASRGVGSGSQIFLADTCRGANAGTACGGPAVRVSAGADGSALGGANRAPSVSADGRFVAFESGTAGGAANVLLRDTCAGASASCAASTAIVAENAAAPALSANGRYVSFVMSAPDGGGGGSAAGSAGTLYVYDTCFGVAAGCTAQAYPMSASGTNLTVNASPAPFTSDGGFLVFSALGTPGAALSGYGDVLLLATPF